jgi:AhpD family alkylhydroperoxidase
VAERELIAAYVAGLNACGYCHGIHIAVAEAFGIAYTRCTPGGSPTSYMRA